MVLTMTNLLGLQIGKWTQNILTLLKVAGLGVIILVALTLAPPENATVIKPGGDGSLGLALILVMFAYGGWSDMDEEPIAKKAFADVSAFISKDNTAFSQAGGEEFLAFHLITETMLQKGGNDWATWFPTVRDKIIAVQNQDGSWTGHHCITSRTFCTSAAILVLTSPNRYLPISQA